MYKKICYFLSILVIALITAGFYFYPDDICRQAHCVTVSDIQNSLQGTPPLSVGFDIDETVLFASPVFYHVAKEQCEGILSECLNDPAFWESVNQLDSFSLPKEKGVALVKMHLARGDTVYFVTARRGTQNEKVTDTLRDLFDAPDLHPVIFTGYSRTENLKVAPLQQNKIKIFYGDSDSDIEAAIQAGARPIRILRAANTLETHSSTKLGAYQEEIVRESHF